MKILMDGDKTQKPEQNADAKRPVELVVMPPLLRLTLVGTAFIFCGVTVEALDLITEPPYWAFFGAVWGMIAVKAA